MDILIIILLVLIAALAYVAYALFEDAKSFLKDSAFGFDDWIVSSILVPIRNLFGLPTTAPQYWGPKTKEEADKLTHKTSRTGDKKPEDFVFESSPDKPKNGVSLPPEQEKKIKDWLKELNKKRPTDIKGSFQ